MSVRSNLRRTLEVWRPALVSDGMGGSTSTFVNAGEVRGKVDLPSATEKTVAQEDGSYHSHRVYLMPSADVRRGDELRGDGQSFRVISVVEPSRPVYKKCFVELLQSEGGTP